MKKRKEVHHRRGEMLNGGTIKPTSLSLTNLKR